MFADWNLFSFKAKTLDDRPKYLRAKNGFVWCSHTSLVNSKQCYLVGVDIPPIFCIHLLYSDKYYTVWCAGYSIFTLGRTPVMSAIKSQWGAFSVPVNVPFTVSHWRAVLDSSSLDDLKAVAANSAPGCEPQKSGVKSMCQLTFSNHYLNFCIIFPTDFFFKFHYCRNRVGVSGDREK